MPMPLPWTDSSYPYNILYIHSFFLTGCSRIHRSIGLQCILRARSPGIRTALVCPGPLHYGMFSYLITPISLLYSCHSFFVCSAHAARNQKNSFWDRTGIILGIGTSRIGWVFLLHVQYICQTLLACPSRILASLYRPPSDSSPV